jgi:putative transposase
MPKNNFPANSDIEIHGTRYRYDGHVQGRMQLTDPAGGPAFALPDESGVLRPITDAQFGELQLAGSAKVVRKASHDRVRHMNDVAQWTITQAMKIEPEAGKMLVTCRMLDDAGVPNGRKAIEQHLAKHWTAELIDEHGPHDPASTIERWRSKRGHPGTRHAGQMIRLNGKVPRGPYCGDLQAEMLQKHALAHYASKIKIKSAYSAYHAELTSINEGRHLDHPQPDEPYAIASYDTFRRRCYALEQQETVRSKRGSQAVQQDWMGGGRSLTADFAMQRVIIDHTPLDVIVIYQLPDGEETVLGRPWLTLAIDVATRAVVSHVISFIPPCVWTVGETIWRMAMPKRVPTDLAEKYPILEHMRGKPLEIVVDNALEFRSHMMEAASRSAAFSVRFCPVKRPRYRGVGERGIDTITKLICDDLPGKTIAISEARRIGYDASKHATLYMEELEDIASRAIAIYNTEPHPALGQRQPALEFQRDVAANGINNFIDLDAFRRDLMPVEEKRQLSNTGIVFQGLRYNGFNEVRALLDDLRPLECRRQRREEATATVDFRYDPMDISRIHVWNRGGGPTSSWAAATSATPAACPCSSTRPSGRKQRLSTLRRTVSMPAAASSR